MGFFSFLKKFLFLLTFKIFFEGRTFVEDWILCIWASLMLQRFKYEKDMITDKDWLNIQLSAEERGFDRGVFEGEARGEAEAKAEIARNMKIRGLAGQLISEVTGLTPEEVASL